MTPSVRLGEVASALRGVTFSAADARTEPFAGGIPCLTTAAVKSEVDWQSARFVPEKLVTDSQFVRPGDILVSTTNSREKVGTSVHIASVPGRAAFGAFVCMIRMGDRLNSEYLALWLKSSYFFDQVRHLVTQTTGFANLSISDLLSVEIPLPTRPDQHGIAAQLAAQLADAHRARTAIISSSSTNRTLALALVERWFGLDATRSWDRPALATLLSSPLRTGISAREVSDGGLPGLSLAAVRNGRLDLTQPKRVGVDETTNRLVREGCFYIVRGNGRLDLVGRAGLAPRPSLPVVFPDLLIETELDPTKVHAEFFQLVWDSREIRADVEARARTASGIHKINLGNLSRVCVPMPSLVEQRRISARLRERLATVDLMEAATKAEQQAVDALPAALLRRAFDGMEA